MVYPSSWEGESTPSRAVVQSAGKGARLKSLGREGRSSIEPVLLLHLLLRYTQALITQMAQTAVCNRHHSLDQQLCRWLLLSLDRLEGNELVMTQELIANMLGVRREGVTEGALSEPQHAGLISYARGRITVLNRSGLEKRSCECYAVVKKEYDRLLPAHYGKLRHYCTQPGEMCVDSQVGIARAHHFVENPTSVGTAAVFTLNSQLVRNPRYTRAFGQPKEYLKFPHG